MGIKLRKEKTKDALMFEDVKAENIDDLKKEIKTKFDHMSIVVATKDDLKNCLEKETKRICAKYDSLTLTIDSTLKNQMFELDEKTKQSLTDIKESF
jgi:hypothetical protein